MKTLQLKTVIALCLLMLFMGITIKAQDRKPSKQETIEYIENYFKDEFFTSGRGLKRVWGPPGIIITGHITVRRVAIQDCKLYFSYGDRIETLTTKGSLSPKINDYEKTIDLSKVEAISLLKDRSGEAFYVELFFIEKNNPHSKNVGLPILLVPAKESDLDNLKSYDIFKAFEHLRKLCGAPEPLKF